MSFLLGRVLHSSPKSFISDRIFSFTAMTSLHFVNHNNRIINHTNKISCRKVPQSLQVQQHRYFSIDFNDTLYESFTTNRAVNFITGLLIKAHDLSGLNWWETLVGAPLILKLLYSVPWAVYQHKLGAKTELITIQSKPLIDKLKQDIKTEGMQKMWPPQQMERKYRLKARLLMRKVMVDNNIHPFKLVILSLINMPPWVLLTMTISKLANDVSSGALDSKAAALQFREGGPFWCPDLSAPDPTYILPTALFILTVVNFEINWILKPQKNTALLKAVTLFCRVFSVIFFFIALNTSSALSVYWVSNSIFSLGQNLVLHSPKVRKMLRIPKTPADWEKPYSHVASEMKRKLMGIFSKK